MFNSETKIRVRYAETDRMGYLYYGNYATYFEVGRVEALRDLGFSYKEMEDQGIILPVVDLQIRYKRPAYYDDLLTVRTRIIEMPTAKLKFEYEVFNEKKEKLTEGSTVLVFVDKSSGKPCMAPDWFLEAFKGYF